MTARIPLFEFMPYGAPELMAASRRHMLRGLMTSCALMTAMFATLLLILPRLPEAPPIEVAVSRIDVINPNLVVSDPVRPKQPRVKVKGGVKSGAIVPVLDELLGEESDSFEEFDYGSQTRLSGDGTIGTEPTQVTGTDDVLPQRGEYVFHEQAPVPIKTPTFYPDFAREAGIEGRVLVHILIGKDGRVLRAEVDEKIHDLALDDAALEAVKQWVFTPAMSNGHPVAVWDAIPFVFKLH